MRYVQYYAIFCIYIDLSMLSVPLYRRAIEKQLQQLGLSSTQSQIYLTILTAQKTTVLEVSRATGIQRPTIYDNVAELERSLLVSYIVEGGRKYIVANDPANLALLVQQKQIAMQEVVPALQELYKREEVTGAHVRFYHGAEGLKKLADVILTSEEKVMRTIADYERNIQEPFSEQYLHTLWEARDRRHISGRVLYTHRNVPALRANKDFSETGNIRYNREVRILPKEIDLAVLYTIVDNNVLFWGEKQEDVSFQFVSESYATSLKSLFDYLWGVSEKL